MSFQKQIAVLFLGATLAFGALAAPFLSQSAYAQTVTTGDIVGRITDPTGATVAGATVKLTSLDTDAVTTVVTSEDGSFRFPLLRPGNYALVVEGHGLSADVKSATVNVGSATRLDIKAQPVGAAQTVEVTATSEALLQPDNANITTTYDTEQLALLPIPGGDISNIPFTAPGVNLSTGAGYGAFTAFGVSATSNLFTLNGNDTMDPYNNLNNSGASNLTLGANEVQEVAVVSNGYSGQYGRMAGAQVNFTTLAGTNKFHGNAVYYWNGTILNANDWFNVQSHTPIPHAVSNQWATRVGGPIIKNKLFFFADYEGLRYVLPGGGVVYTPSPAFQAATIANLQVNNPSQLPWYQTQFNLYNTGPGASRAEPVTATDDPALGCGDFDGTTVGPNPDSRIHANPRATFGTGGIPCAYKFQNTTGSLNTEALYSVRIDQVIGAKDQINYRYKHDWGTQATGTDPINSAFNANSVQPQWEGQLNETHTFSPTMTNNFIMSGSYYSAIFGPSDINHALSVFPTTVLPLDGLGFAFIGGTDYNYPQGRRVTQYQFVDDLSIIKGKNAVKVGVNFRRNDITDLRAGVLTSGRTEFFSNTDYYNGVLSAPTGSFIQQRFALNQEAPINTYTLGFYGQDEYAASPQLKLTFALRFDRNANPTCTDNCFNRFYSDFGNIDHSVTTPYNSSIKTGISNAYPAVDPILVQPRFGFAYSPESQGGKTVIRGGIGLFADLIPAQLVDNYILNAPGVTSFTVVSGGDNVPVAMGTPGNGYDIAAQSNAAFQSGFANGATLAQLQVATNGNFATPAFSSIVDKLKNPTYLEYNLEWQQQIGQFDAIDINYVGNYAYNVLQNNATPNAYAACATASPTITDPDTGVVSTNPNYCPGGFGGLPNAQVDRRFKIITNLTNMGHANYNGVTASFRHHIRYGLMLNANYAWSHDLDTCSNGCLNEFNLGNGATYFNTQVNPAGNNLNYGNSDYDIRQSFSLNYVWQAPFKASNAFANALVKGWTLSGTLYSRTGYPYSVYNSKIPGNLLGSRSGGTVLAGHISGKSASCGNGNDVCLDASQFATSATQYLYGFGNQARNSYRGPMYFDTDANLAKITPIKEGVSFKIGANFFNILNHPNFASPTNDVTNGGFGTITSTVTPPSSPYGSFTGSAVSGRVVQVMGAIQF